MVKKRKWSAEQRQNFNVTMNYRKLEKERERAKQIMGAPRVEALKEEREERTKGIDVSVWRNTQRPTHIYIQEAGRLRRYDLRSLEVYVPENIVL